VPNPQVRRTALLLIALPLLAGSGGAWAGDLLGDAPGTRHRIDPAALPPPYVTPSAADSPEIVRRPEGAAPRAPAGFTVSLWAEHLDQPRALRRAPDGSIFLAESGAGRVLRFTAAGTYTVFARGLDLPFGIAFWPPRAPAYVYVAETGRVLRYPWHPGQPAPAGKPEVVIPALPTGGHWTRDLAVSPDGARLLVSVGSDTNLGREMPHAPPGGLAAWQAAHGLGAAWGEEAGRAVVEWFRPDGVGGLHPFAQGLRNCSSLTVQPATGMPWCATNERDGLGDDLPPDFATHVTEGAFYGWPWFYWGAHQDPSLRGRRPDLAGHVTVPDVPIQAHSAPLGITFYDRTAFPREYQGDAFVALHGSWNRSRPTGYKVIRLHMDPSGRPDGSYEDFLTGFAVSERAVWGRPVGVAVAADGALLVSEDAGGTIWRIAPAAP
jgi:glucose/arabinose dehydrogenase